MDISTFSLAELKDLLNRIPSEIKRREQYEKVRALKDIEAFAAERGFTLDELMGSAATKVKKAKGTVAVKYRHPSNHELAWTGRGRTPKWVLEFQANGGLMEQLMV